ncbi:MAG TPA: helix-turn-helix domain-containing protein [Candidatus Nanoarchaeia archaeon]|nr:helix-turn-helix domain-containing protein [Candidatus Nanoarchaeia archaeon]
MDIHLKEILLKVGLTSRESEAYLSLLKRGESSAFEVSKDIKESRTNVYSTLLSLIKRGLVTYIIKRSKKFFKAANPEILLEIIKEREQLLSTNINSFLNYYQPYHGIQVEVYEGTEGIKTIWNEVLREGKEVFVIGSTGESTEVLQGFNFIKFHKARLRKKIRLKILVNTTKKAISHAKKIVKIGNGEYRVLPFDKPVTTYIYGDNVVLFEWKKSQLTAVHITSKGMAESFKSQFKFIWDRCTSFS